MRIRPTFILAMTLGTWLALRAAAVSAQTQPAKEAQLDFGLDGLSIPPARVVSGHTPRTAELLSDAQRSQNPLVWKRARYVADLGRVGLPAGSAAVAEAMKDPSPQVRGEAARSAAAIGDAALLTDVEKLLGDADAGVRREAVLAAGSLARSANKTTTPAVERGLADAQPQVIAAAIEVAWAGDHAALIAAKLAAMPAELQPDAALALGRLKLPKQSPALLPLLGSGDVVARTAALHALGEIGDASRVDAVAAKLDDPHPTVRREAIAAIGKLAAADAPVREKHALRMLADADPTVREAAARVLTPIRSAQAAGGLVAQLDVAYAPLHEAVRDALSHPADDATRRAVTDAAAAMLAHADARRREDASFVLGRLHSPAAIDAHVALLHWDKTAPAKTDWPLIAQAAESLGLIGDPKASDGLLALAAAAPQALPPAPQGHSSQREAMAGAMSNAVVALARLRHGPALSEAVRILRLEPSGCPPRLRAAAAFAVGVLAPQNSSSPPPVNLFGIVDSIDEDHLTKIEAIKALGNLRYAPAAQRLETIAGNEPSPDLRWIAHWAEERCSGKSVPYVPPTELREPPVSVTDLAR